LPEKITLGDMDNAPSETAQTETDVVVTKDDLTVALARVSDENFQLKQDLDEAEKKIRKSEILDNMLEPSAKKAFNYMFAYSGAVGLILLMNGFGCFVNMLDAEVLKFLVGSTAVTVIGLVGMVLTGVFIGARK
jgi:hypothetical protein